MDANVRSGMERGKRVLWRGRDGRSMARWLVAHDYSSSNRVHPWVSFFWSEKL